MIPTRVGQKSSGGYFAGINRIRNDCYAIIVAPKCTETDLMLKTTLTATPATQSINNGLSNTLAMNSVEHPAAQYCLGLVVDGCNDFYLPSTCELELFYRNLKPLDSKNYVLAEIHIDGHLHHANGSNLFSIPIGSAYTDLIPACTIVTGFISSESFNTNPYYFYWASTEIVSNTAASGVQLLFNGCQYCHGKFHVGRVRAVRRILLTD